MTQKWSLEQYLVLEMSGHARQHEPRVVAERGEGPGLGRAPLRAVH